MEEKKQKQIQEINEGLSLFFDKFENKDEFTKIFLEVILNYLKASSEKKL